MDGNVVIVVFTLYLMPLYIVIIIAYYRKKL